MPGTEISVSTFLSNDTKAKLLVDIFRDLGISPNSVKSSMNEAHNKEKIKIV